MVGARSPSSIAYRRAQARWLREGQDALNIAFGAILSAYIGNSLAEIDNRPFDHDALARFFVLLAIFIVGLCLGNAALVRGSRALGLALLTAAGVAALFAHHEGRVLGFEVVVLRLVAACWFGALMTTSAFLSFAVHIHYRWRR